MGDAVNAAALGKVGIAVGWTPETFRAFLNLKRYFEYLGSVGKNTFNLGNLLIVDKDQLLASLQWRIDKQIKSSVNSEANFYIW